MAGKRRKLTRKRLQEKQNREAIQKLRIDPEVVKRIREKYKNLYGVDS